MIYLDDYPLEAVNEACFHYMHHSINWDKAFDETNRRGVSYFHVSDAIRLFPHLKLDKQYALYCYVAREYHGLWGQVAAVRTDASPEPVNIRTDFLLGPSFDLPEAGVPPMEAIYNDGSPFGFFEALLAAELLSAIPYTRFEQEHWDNCVLCPPPHYETEWERYIELPDWRPRFLPDRSMPSIYLCWRNFQSGWGSSDGCDSIYLARHTFQSRLAEYHAFYQKDRPTLFRSRLDDDSRYGKENRCCVAVASQILLARQNPDLPLSL